MILMMADERACHIAPEIAGSRIWGMGVGSGAGVIPEAAQALLVARREHVELDLEARGLREGDGHALLATRHECTRMGVGGSVQGICGSRARCARIWRPKCGGRWARRWGRPRRKRVRGAGRASGEELGARWAKGAGHSRAIDRHHAPREAATIEFSHRGRRPRENGFSVGADLFVAQGNLNCSPEQPNSSEWW